MKKLAAILLTLGFAAVPAAAPAQSVTVIVNGQTMQFPQPPIERAGRVFVPLRGIFEQLGASVVYSNGQINATGRGRTVSLVIGSTHATVDGQPQILDVAPFIVGATTFVPLRFISQALGAAVNWNNATSTVTITGAAPVAPPPQPVRPPPRPVRPPPQPVRPPAVALVNQSPTGTIFNRNPRIRFAFNRPARFSTIRVWLNGQNVSSGLQTNGEAYVVTLPGPVPRGPNRVRVTGTTQGGIPFEFAWNFTQGR
jgi:Copper amine oxidase N-terminal domain